ncbi:MAG: hybrid sensor histidine kinase/response regulator [Hyphomicrobiales bacterium]|nr:hybrid sensor histidine kinase/response regulator [Hyphomicrobiales bacterium]
MRLYFTEYAASAIFGVRPLQFAAVIGAIVVGLILHATSGVRLHFVALWWSTIALGEGCVVVVNMMFLARPRSDDELPRWAKAKAAIAGFGGLTWSLGPYMIHVDGEVLTTIVPPWMIITYCCGAVWAGAFYAPALVAMVTASTLPAALWLLRGQGIEEASGTCLLIAAPYFLVLGRNASLRYRAAVIDKIEIALLLQKQRADSVRIEELGRERARFFSAASHDLRQPLHAMGLYLTLLRDDPRGREREELIDNLSQCAASLDSQFDAILGVNETDRLLERARLTPIPLQTLFDRIAAQARPRAAALGLSLRVLPTRAWVDVSQDTLERVIANLVSNALKFTDCGGVLVGARRRGAQIAIVVADTGVGIAPEHQAAVFDDYVQIGNPQRDNMPGYGLGLAIVRRLCMGMDWRIDMNSRPGRGTSFSILVPSATPALRPQTAPVEASSLLKAQSTLVVDDDARVRDAMRRMFERWGVDGKFCASADEALCALQAADGTTRWRALIDYRLGGDANGLDLVEEIRRRFGDRVEPAIVTGESDEALEARAAELGLAILRKPVQPVRLRALLAR